MISYLRRANVARVQFLLRLHNQLRHPRGLEVQEVPCPLCGAESGFRVRYRPFLRSPLKVVVCGGCSLSFLNPMPTAAFYQRYYNRSYMEGREDNPRTLSYKQQSEAIASFLAPYIPLCRADVPVILEIGAAHGTNLIALRERLPTAQLYEDEINRRWEATYAQHGIRHWEPHLRADFVVLAHVLEHFANPIAAARRVTESLRPGGIVYIEVPHVPRDYGPTVMYHLTHTMYFSKETFLAVTAAGGLENVAIAEGEVLRGVFRAA